jgi:hypothetical protein
MTKRSRHEQSQRVAEQERITAIEASWQSRISAEDQAAFRREVELAQARVLEPRPDMAPGTRPNPARPGREPKVVEDQRTRRSWV